MNEPAHTEALQGLICAYDLDRKGCGTELGWEQIRAPAPPGVVRWVHLDFSEEAACDWLRNESGIEPLIVEAMLQDDIRPRSLQTERGILAVLRSVNLNPGSDVEDMVSVRVWLEKNRIISTRRRRLMAVLQIRDEVLAGFGPGGPGEFLERLVGHMGDAIAAVVENIDESIERAESAMGRPNDAWRRNDFGKLRRKTAHLRRYLAPQREALDRLSRMQGDVISHSSAVHLQEETNRMTLFVEELDLTRERAMVSQEELLAMLAQEQNSKMYLLAMVSAVFLPLTFLTGLMGMNVAGLPGTESPLAFSVLVALMLALGGAILLLFRWKRWM